MIHSRVQTASFQPNRGLSSSITSLNSLKSNNSRMNGEGGARSISRLKQDVA